MSTFGRFPKLNFCKLLKPFLIFPNSLLSFETTTQYKNTMQQHECKIKVTKPYDKFYFNKKIIIFLYFYEHKNS